MEIIVSKISRGVKIPKYDNYERINTTYRGAGIWKELSPMKLGPFNLIEPLAVNSIAIINGKKVEQPILSYYPDGVLPGFEYKEQKDEEGNMVGYQSAECECFEAYWQLCGKIYAHEIDKNGVVKKSYYERRAKGLKMSLENTKPGQLRRAFPKAQYGVPVLSYYQGEFMDWVSSRITIYCPYYTELVMDTEAYKKLEKEFKKSNLQLLDPDAQELGVITKEILVDSLYSTKYPFGHGMVLAALLKNERVWE